MSSRVTKGNKSTRPAIHIKTKCGRNIEFWQYTNEAYLQIKTGIGPYTIRLSPADTLKLAKFIKAAK